MIELKKLAKKQVAVGIIAAIGLLLSYVVVFSDAAEEVSAYDGMPKALILDQLHDELPNVDFQQQAKKYLETSGYEVDIITTESITVDFYKKLPSMNYKFIIVRSHGVVDKSVEDGVSLFTGEKYREDMYTIEQLSGQVKKGTSLIDVSFSPSNQESENWVKTGENQFELISPVDILDESKDEYFLISSKFIKESMSGKFSDTVFFLGGCETMSEPSMAKSLVGRGASLVVGWDDTIGSIDNDRTMLRLLKNFLIDELDIQEAVDSANPNPIEYMNYPSNLIYYSNDV